MEGKVVIYVAGNPDASPMEYYDEETGTYKGVIPELLRRFSEESRFEILYYQAGEKDRRENLGEQMQVDILSGYRSEDAAPSHQGEAVILSAVQESGNTDYVLYFTEAAPEDLREELPAFLQTRSQTEMNGLLLEAAQMPESVPRALYLTAGGIFLALAVLTVFLAAAVGKYRKRLRQSEQEREIDEITGLGNLDYLERYYRQMIHDKNRMLYHLVYFFLDTDRLRRLISGEQLEEFLRYCAVILQENMADTDILARVSDGGFALFRLSGSLEATEEWIVPVTEKICAYPQKYGVAAEATAAAGIYPLKSGDRDLNEMLFNASQTAHMAERKKRKFAVCSDDVLRRFLEERQLQERIGLALERREFQMYLQFYVDPVSRQIVGGEALTRWQHPEKGLLNPSRFITLMEQEGTISRLDYYCLEEICTFLDELVDQGIRSFFISCNFSRITFSSENFVEECRKRLDQHHFPKELLIFELTESVAGANLAQIRANALELQQLGARIALDDFGEGFTSFCDLQQFPMDGLKLDKSLIDNIETVRGQAILKAMIQVGHELNMTILAEGVEREEQVKLLKEMKCDVIQGFRFYHPLPLWEARERLQERFRKESGKTETL